MGTQDKRAVRPQASFSYLTLRPLQVSSSPQTIDSLEDWEQMRMRIPATPSTAAIRGLFPAEIVKLVPEVKAPRARYVAFSNYPMSEYLDLILQAARISYPNMTAGNAVLRLGAHVYATFASSLAGMAIFSMAGYDFRRVVDASPKAYEVTLKPGKVTVVRNVEHEVLVQLREVWAFPDIFHAGIWLGGMAACRISGRIEITRRSLCDVDFLINW